MSEVDSIEATRREFESVMRATRFATIEQVAAGLTALIDAESASSDGPSASTHGTSTPHRLLPARSTHPER